MIYLYAVYCKLSHRVKIGFSKNVSKRFKALQAHCSTDLELYGYVALRNCVAIERFLHASLKEFNTHGE
jgi:predicted GIY-YIG superfamily endonuclease